MKLDNYVDIKVFILYLMKNVGEPLEFTTVNDIVLQDEFVGYFDFAFCFSDLLDAGAIVSEESGGKTLYSVSALGLETLESYEGSLLPVIKERALRSALRLIAFNRSGSRITTDINEVTGGYMLVCRIKDKERTLFSTEIFIAERAIAEKYRANFEERAEVIFRGVLSLLSGDVNYLFDE